MVLSCGFLFYIDMEERERKIDDKQCIERGRDEGIADKDRVGSRIDDEDETESKLDVSSDQFDPLLALYSPKITLPFPNIKCFNNIAEYESFLKGGPGRAKPENVEKRLRKSQKGVPDPCRIERLKKLIVNAPPDEGEGSCGKKPPRKQKGRKNVLTRMPLHAGSPLGELHRCVQERIRVKVHIRTFKGLRGVCSGFVVAFDKFWNMAMVDVDETYRRPLLGEAFYHERALTVTRLFDRLKLQESPEFRLAEQKEPNPEGRGGFKAPPTEAREQYPTSLLRRSPRKRIEAGSGSISANQGSQRGSGELRTTGTGHSSRTEGEHKETPPSRVDYQRVHTRHINQLFIRGENVLLINLQP